MKSVLSIIFMFSSFGIFAQLSISGSVYEGSTPLEFATVVLYDSTSSIVDSDITNENGGFYLEAKKGTYHLEITYIGLSTYGSQIELTADMDMDAIYMITSSLELDQVNIVAKKRLIEQKPDRLIFNVAGNIASKGGNAMDIMKIAPGLIVSTDGISMIGRSNARILLNGRLLQLDGEALVEFISGLSAEDIEKLEIITNPPAQYEAAGSGGLINIVLKKGRSNSWKNGINVSYNQSLYDFYTFSDQFNLNRNKVRLSASVSTDLGHRWEREGIAVQFPGQEWDMEMNSKNSVSRFTGKLLFDYDVNEKWTTGVQYFGSIGNPGFNSLAITSVGGDDVEESYHLVNNSTRAINLQNQSFNFHNKWALDSAGRTIVLDLDLFEYKNSFTQNTDVDLESDSNQFIEKNLFVENNADQIIRNQSLKLDFVQPLSLLGLSYGLKYSRIKSINGILSYNLMSGEPVLDQLLSNEFDYTEHTSAIYVSGSKTFSPKFSAIIGLRLESTNTTGVSETLGQENTNQYYKLFPSFFTSYVATEASKFSFNYGRRINRPGFRDLNPFRIYINDQSYSEGNPFLQPSFSDNFDFNHTYNGVFNSNIFFNYLTDGFGTVFSADPITQEQATIRRNYFTNYNLGIGERISLEPTNWWSTQNQIYLIQSSSKFDDTVDGVEQNGIQFYFSTSNSISMGKNSKAQVDFWYRPAYRSNIFEVGETYSLDLSYSRSFLDSKWNLSISANDILDSASYDYLASVVNGVKTVYSQNYSSRNLRVTLSYNFGNKKINVGQRDGGNEEEKRRSN
ncbi:outer membrane beta-barrel family protein [Portibacter lacus]|nr:outer membrane beta-barrel family protein [Portibacter lacus]